MRGVLAQGQYLLRLVNQLLDLARIESGKMTLKARRQDLVTCLRDHVRSFAPMAERRQLTLQFHSEIPVYPLVFDRDKVEKVVGNLLSNALKFTPEGGKVRVTIERPSSEFIDVMVKDTGPGIPREALDRLFDRFERLDAPATRRQEGTGIGLALAQELVELHGGEIKVESEEGFGSTFIVRLPTTLQENLEGGEREVEVLEEAGTVAIKPIELMPAGRDTGSAAEVAGADFHRGTILLVEDNEEVRTFVRAQLESTFDIIEAADGEEALAQVQAHRPDLVLSDVMMPGMDGFELCRRLKSDEALHHIPVILLTARAGESDTVQGLEYGADDYVVKPFSTEELRARMDGLIRSRRELRRQFSREVVLQPSGVVVQPEDEAFLERVLEIVEVHMDDSTFGVDRLADELAISSRQLSRKLRSLTKKTPAALIWEIRLARAAQLLEAHAGTVAEVAYSVGFKSASHFSTAFRKAYGVSPSAFAETRP